MSVREVAAIEWDILVSMARDSKKQDLSSCLSLKSEPY